jgi:FMN phosphatase YigB (HAD superfamily)|tara:strand:+ start:2401 stop:2946 length:546 start_codon:yes stop_codon:yes gene_type:complete
MKKSLVDLLEAYPIAEKKEVPPYKIYCDMDGVLTDFESRFEHYSGMHPQAYEKEKGTPAFWELIDNKVGVKFWVGMDYMPQGKQLWDFIKPYKPDLLSSPSRHNNSRLGKNLWVRNNLDPKPKLIFAYSKAKSRYANENSILIDDKPSNIDEWAAKGGIAIRCKNGNVDHVIEKLKELGYE